MSDEPLRNKFGDFLMKNAEKYENLVVLDADLSSSTRTYKFAKKHPHRFFNFGISEQNMVGAAMGFAISGKISIVSGFSLFTTGRAWEFIRMACHDNLNIKFITTHAGFVGEDGSSHNALEDISLMATLPNMNILIPADNIELEKMLAFALEKQGPFYIRLPRVSFPRIHDKEYVYSQEEIDVIKEGKDLSIIGIGCGISFANQHISKIEKEFNISIKMINLSTIKPLPEKDLIQVLRDIKKILVIEEHNLFCGITGILARIFSEKTPKNIKAIGVHESFGESGKREAIMQKYGFNRTNLTNKIQALLDLD